MTRIAERVHHDPAEIARIESRILELDDQAIFEVLLDDGLRLEGTVTVRPSIQTFRDAEGNEGANALLRLDDLHAPGQSHYLWLDRIAGLQRLGSA